GEFKNVCNAVGGIDNLIDEKSPDAAIFKYLAYPEDKIQKLLENPKLFKTPIVRNGKQATVGYCPEIWEKWE
ncbi:MAG: ArsC family transcriptional regulator, partial [Clostridia bacterium]|nr:ArsC family transcriptional regulator [Clostridia bacterium]